MADDILLTLCFFLKVAAQMLIMQLSILNKSESYETTKKKIICEIFSEVDIIYTFVIKMYNSSVKVISLDLVYHGIRLSWRKILLHF